MSSVRPFKTSTHKILQSWSSVVKLLVWWLVYGVTECHGVKTYHTLWTVLSCLNGEPGAWILDDVGRTTKACHFWGLRSRSVLVWKGCKVICSVSVSSERKGFWCVADHAFMPSVCRCRHCAPQLRGSLVVWHEGLISLIKSMKTERLAGFMIWPLKDGHETGTLCLTF